MDDRKAKAVSGAAGGKGLVGFLTRVMGGAWPWVAAVLGAALIAAWPAVSQPGLLNTRGGGDSPFLLQRLHQMAAALADGHFPVRWMPDANYGYGYPFYNFYAPLSLYIAAGFRFLGFSFVRAIHLAQLAGFAVAGLGMFYLGRNRLGSRWAGLLAAVAYTFAPFHMVNVYVRGDSLAEFWAMTFYPLVLLSADRIFSPGKGAGALEAMDAPSMQRRRSPALNLARPVALFALAYAGLILSHNISALIFSPFLLLYLLARLFIPSNEEEIGGARQIPRGLYRLSSGSGPASLLVAFSGLLLAFALAAWFFVPALAEQDLAQLGPVTEGYFHYSNHFRGLDLVQSGLIFNYDPDGGLAFRLGLLQAVLALVGAIVLLGRRETGSRRHPAGVYRLYIVLGGLIAAFMNTPVSRPLWDHLPLLPFAQFPWRFLSVVSLFFALMAGAVVLMADRPGARAAIAVTGSLVLVAAGLLGLRVDHLILTDRDITPERLAQYEWFTGNIGTTVSAEYLTPESNPRPWTSAWLNAGERDQVTVIAGEVEAALLERSTTRQTWQIRASDGGAEVVLPMMYWPGWRATIDGQATELHARQASGLTALNVPAGEHTVTLALGPTAVRRAAGMVSLVAALITALLLIGGWKAGRRRIRGDAARRPFIIGLVFCAGALMVLAFLWRGDPDDLPPGDLSWDFAQMAYLSHTPGGIAFDDGSRLFEYGYSGDEIAAGATLTVTLSIAPGSGRVASLDLVTPASARPTPDGAAEPPVFASAVRTMESETILFVLPISPDAPPGPVIPRLRIDGARPLTTSGATRGDLFLRPVMVTGEGAGEQESSGIEATGRLDVKATGLVMRDAVTLDGRFAWLTPHPLGTRYQFSWRMQDAAGNILAQLDAQPGYGYQPTTVWPPDRRTADWLALRLPDAVPEPGNYPLVMRLYHATTGDTVLVRRVGVMAWNGDTWRPEPHQPSFQLPDELSPLSFTFSQANDPLIALRGYRLEREPDFLRVTLYWEALSALPDDYTRFVHLVDAAGNNAAQVDGAPAGDSYPTGQWSEGEIVSDAIIFDLDGLPPGEYRLAAGFYRPVEGFPRLDAASPDGPLPDGRVILPEGVLVPDNSQ